MISDFKFEDGVRLFVFEQTKKSKKRGQGPAPKKRAQGWKSKF